MSADGLLRAAREWASADSRVTGLVLVGSHARGCETPESDIDLVILTGVPERLLADACWLNAFGHVRRKRMECYGRVTSVRVWYAGGPEVEFGVTGSQWASLPLDDGTRKVLKDGALVLYDEEGHLTHALSSIGEEL